MNRFRYIMLATIAVTTIAVPFVSAAPAHAASKPPITQWDSQGNGYFKAPATVRVGMKNTSVLTLKTVLRSFMSSPSWDENGNQVVSAAYNPEADSTYRMSDAEVVMNFQKFFGMPADGVVNAATWRMVFMLDSQSTFSELYSYSSDLRRAPQVLSVKQTKAGATITVSCYSLPYNQYGTFDSYVMAQPINPDLSLTWASQSPCYQSTLFPGYLGVTDVFISKDLTRLPVLAKGKQVLRIAALGCPDADPATTNTWMWTCSTRPTYVTVTL